MREDEGDVEVHGVFLGIEYCSAEKGNSGRMLQQVSGHASELSRSQRTNTERFHLHGVPGMANQIHKDRK